MENKNTLKKVVLFLVVMHSLEALLAVRMAKKRGKSAALYFLMTLFIGFPVMLKLRKVEPIEETA